MVNDRIAKIVLALGMASFAVLSGHVQASPMTEADKLYDAGDLKRAADAYREVLKTEPDNVFALEGLESAIRFQPGSTSADVSGIHSQLQSIQSRPYARSKNDELGDAYLRSHDYKNAEPCYRDSLTADAGDNYARMRLIDCLDGQGRKDESAKMAKELQAKTQAAEVSPALKAQIDAGYKALTDKNYDAAAKVFETALKGDANNKDALVGLGDAYVHLNRVDDAKAIEARLAKVDAPKAPDQPAQKFPVAPAGMDHWFAKTQISAGGNLVATFYNLPTGNVYEGLPNGAKTFSELQRVDPAHCGMSSLSGNDLTFTFPGKPTEHHQVGAGMIDSSPLQKVTALQAGAKFDGKFVISNSTSFGGVDSSGTDIWVFKADGTFRHEGSGSVYTTAHHAGTGEHPDQANGAANNVLEGQYSFKNGVMSLTGDTAQHSVWNIGDKNPPWYLLVDGKVYTGQQ